MMRIKYVPGSKYDGFLPLLVHGVKARIMNEKQKDDGLFLYAGKTGTGKSTLLLWTYSIYTPNQDLRFVPRSQAEFASSLKAVKDAPLADRALMYDEAEAGKRDSMSKWNKDLIRVYSKIRGKRIFHGWCYPDSDMIDMKIITNRVNGIFVTFEKNTEGIRRYFFFTQQSIADFIAEYGKLRLDVLIEKAPKYAFYEGYFCEYDGPLRDAYFSRKEEGMDDEIDTFSEKYSDKQVKESIKDVEYFSPAQAGKILRTSKSSVTQAIEYGLANGMFAKSQIMNPVGRYMLTRDDIEKVRHILEMGGRSRTLLVPKGPRLTRGRKTSKSPKSIPRFISPSGVQHNTL